ncbi:Fe(3+)-hydroxamate ABC transporter permease FhuB [Zobellella iuensis]|uniref:Fe(3+)-hydroxamate ABC transporter permease FhuB n=1 Tax=Zobellella iuensis TaxID=2803811 RepID=A0ABS1QW87_9GAMM|nr:Fe(3+)-hydroxamate ABC transporter permease FhuB [Zobellella iuensis]MBL1378706.1 Fe(3+)-hydroxamate ABC transporter permease FhuB [Zobellella iuensis]
MSRYLLLPPALLGLVLLHLQLEPTVPLAGQWALLWGAEPELFEEFQFFYSALPRVAMALLVGGALGLSGSLLQQLTQNRLVSPMTLGASSGAWLGLVCAAIWAPALAAGQGYWFALLGAALSTTLVLLIAGRHGIRGLPVVLAGMAVNLLLGALAAGLVLLHDQYTRNLFIWGAGDLAQTDWHWVLWLLPRLLPVAVALVLFAHRPLTLLRLGDDAARARGLSLWPVLLALLVAALWLSSLAITAVGLIGFIGLLTPNMARFFGARTARDELLFSTLLGGLLLLATDAIALGFSRVSTDLVPSGAAAALIGAPALLWLLRSRMHAQDQSAIRLPGERWRVTRRHWLAVAAAILALLLVNLTLAPAGQGWQWSWPDELLWSLRWPRLLTAAAAGAGLAVAGVILQRLIRNPLASPDIMGISAGATLALVLGVLLGGGSIHDGGPLLAFGGSMTVLAILLLLGRRHGYAPAMMALVGIALAAFLDALLQFTLAKGNDQVFAILGWLAGSTYRVSEAQAGWLTAGILLSWLLALGASRGLTLVSIGDGIALGRGLALTRTRVLLLVLVSVICALVTAVMGPVAFVGLLAPHMASLLGARKAGPQLLLASLLGMALMLLSDWLGRVLLYPMQLPAGTLASIMGGTYFIYLLARKRAL